MVGDAGGWAGADSKGREGTVMYCFFTNIMFNVFLGAGIELGNVNI